MPDRLHRRARRARRPGYVFGPSGGGPDVGITMPPSGPVGVGAAPAPDRDEREDHEALRPVREGMAVSDAAGAAIGRVRSVHRGGADPAGSGTLLPSGLDGADERLREELRARLLHRGFVLIAGAGALAADRYALPDQIASVSAGEVRLRVWRDQLIRATGRA